MCAVVFKVCDRLVLGFFVRLHQTMAFAATHNELSFDGEGFGDADFLPPTTTPHFASNR